jgi:hypothetical protein
VRMRRQRRTGLDEFREVVQLCDRRSMGHAWVSRENAPS